MTKYAKDEGDWHDFEYTVKEDDTKVWRCTKCGREEPLTLWGIYPKNDYDLPCTPQDNGSGRAAVGEDSVNGNKESKAEIEKLPHRFKTQFIDATALWGSFELPQPETRNRDVVSLKYWLVRMRKFHPEMAQHIVDTAELIVAANEEQVAVRGRG